MQDVYLITSNKVTTYFNQNLGIFERGNFLFFVGIYDWAQRAFLTNQWYHGIHQKELVDLPVRSSITLLILPLCLFASAMRYKSSHCIDIGSPIAWHWSLRAISLLRNCSLISSSNQWSLLVISSSSSFLSSLIRVFFVWSISERSDHGLLSSISTVCNCFLSWWRSLISWLSSSEVSAWERVFLSIMVLW